MLRIYRFMYNIVIIQMRNNKLVRSDKNDNVKVVVRVRPPLARELGGGLFLSTVEVDESRTKLQLFEFYNVENLIPHQFEKYMENPNNFSKHNFTFDQVYDDESNQE